MTWDSVWEKIFSDREEWGKYPPEELVRFIASNYYRIKDRKGVMILELGCGPGGGPSWYIAKEGFSYFGIDGSPTAIEKAKKRFFEENLHGEFTLGFFDKLPWNDATFDAVIDVASLQCNPEKETKQILEEVIRVLKPNGNHFSLTAKAGCWGDGTGSKIDGTTYEAVTEGPFAHMGIMRFATRESLIELYKHFKNLNLEYSIRTLNNCKNEISDWIVTCERN
jgi:ubiquinone/menaquinone biosynthesis C-methylase UbiE